MSNQEEYKDNEKDRKKDLDDIAIRIRRAELLHAYKIRWELNGGEVRNWWEYRPLEPLPHER